MANTILVQTTKSEGKPKFLKTVRANLIFKSGLKMLGQGRIPDALVRFDKAVRFNPTLLSRLDASLALAYVKRGTEKCNEGNCEAALEDGSKALAIAPNSEGAVKLLAAAYFQKGRNIHNYSYIKAIESYTAAIKFDPENADAYVARGDAKFKEHEWADANFPHAIADYTMAIQLRPGFAEAYIKRGDAKVKAKQFDEAMSDFRTAMELEGKSAEKNAEFHLKYAGKFQDCSHGLYFSYYNDHRYELNLPNNRSERNNILNKIIEWGMPFMKYGPKDVLHAGTDDILFETYIYRGVCRFDNKEYEGAESDFSNALKFQRYESYTRASLLMNKINDARKAQGKPARW